MTASSNIVRFGVFELDLRAGELRKAGVRLSLQPQPLQVLSMLLERPGELVTREELRKQLWPDDTFVDFQHGLNAAVNRLRETLGDSADTPRFIETVPRRGYRFVAPLSAEQEERNLQSRSDVQLGGRGMNRGDAVTAAPPLAGWRPWKRSHWPALVLGIAVCGAVWLYLSRPLLQSTAAPMRTVPLTSLPGRESEPSFSPDGSQIAFVWDGGNGQNEDIYVAVIGAGEPVRLTTNPAADRNPAWSPDGRHIAFTRHIGAAGELLLIPALGGPERKITSLWVDEYKTALSWSPGGRHLAYSDKRPQDSHSIVVLSIESLEKRQLTTPLPTVHRDFVPAISPGGRTVAFNRVGAGGGVYLVPLAGGEPRRLTVEQDAWLDRLAWTADGQELVFAVTGAAAPETSSGLWRVSVSGGSPKQLSIGDDNASNPAVSLRGNRLAYEQRSQDANIWKVEVPAPGVPSTSPTQLIASTRHEAGPQFSPDGTKIAFHSDRSGSMEIWVCDANGLNAVQLTSFGGLLVGTPRWSPDGRRIAFDGGKGHADIYVVDVDGGLPRRVTSEESDEVAPSWSRNARWIYFASKRTGRWEVWKVPPAGGEAVQVTRRGGFAAFESTDGRFLYYSKGFDEDIAGLWRVAVNGEDETRVLDLPQAGYWGYFAVVKTGIYVVDITAQAQPTLQFLHFADNRVTQVMSLKGKPIQFEPGLAISPDGRWILYTQEDHRTSDLMLVEEFR